MATLTVTGPEPLLQRSIAPVGVTFTVALLLAVRPGPRPRVEVPGRVVPSVWTVRVPFALAPLVTV